MSDALFLHGRPSSPARIAVEMALHEKGLHERWQERSSAANTSSSDLGALVEPAFEPMLVAGSEELIGVCAIATFLDGLAPHPALWPEDPVDRARAMSIVTAALVGFTSEPQATASWLNRTLALRPYLAVPRLTMADLSAFAALSTMGKASVALDRLGHLAVWHGRIAARPSARATGSDGPLR